MYEDAELIARDLERGQLYVSNAHPDPIVILDVKEFDLRTVYGYERWRRIRMLDRGVIKTSEFHDEEPMGWIAFRPGWRWA